MHWDSLFVLPAIPEGWRLFRGYFLLYDEFGHSTIPHFVETANTIRAYKVSLSIVLQSISQLNSKYGQNDANSILGSTCFIFNRKNQNRSLFIDGVFSTHILGGLCD